MSEGHRILIVEDEPAYAEALAARVRAKGWTPTVVDNARDAAAIVAEQDFCGGFVDSKLPYEPKGIALVETGFTLIERSLRVRFGRFDEKTRQYLVPLVVVSAETAPKSISRALELGGDAFVDKADLEDPTYVTGKLEERLRLAGRADHAACGRLAVGPRVHAGGRPRMCTIVIDGRIRASKTLVHINEQERLLSSGNFRPFLRLSVMSLRNPEEWGHKAVLGFGASTGAPSRLRSVFAGLVPDDFEALEWDHEERFRWNPLVVVDRIDWDVLAVHSDAPARKLAAENLGKVAKKRHPSKDDQDER